MRIGPSSFSGRLEGNRISGSRVRDDGIRDSWNATLQGIDFSAVDRKRINDSRDALRDQESRLQRMQRQYDSDLSALQKKRRQWESEKNMYQHDLDGFEKRASSFVRKVQEFKQKSPKR